MNLFFLSKTLLILGLATKESLSNIINYAEFLSPNLCYYRIIVPLMLGSVEYDPANKNSYVPITIGDLSSFNIHLDVTTNKGWRCEILIFLDGLDPPINEALRKCIDFQLTKIKTPQRRYNWEGEMYTDQNLIKVVITLPSSKIITTISKLDRLFRHLKTNLNHICLPYFSQTQQQ